MCIVKATELRSCVVEEQLVRVVWTSFDFGLLQIPFRNFVSAEVGFVIFVAEAAADIAELLSHKAAEPFRQRLEFGVTDLVGWRCDNTRFW